MKIRTSLITAVTIVLLAACTTTPEPAPTGDAAVEVPTSAPSPVSDVPTDTGEGYPAPEEPAAEEVNPPSEETETEPGYPAPEDGVPDCTPGDAAPQRHEFPSEDGLGLVGLFYNSANCDAPLIILFHQFAGSKEDWTDLALWLQNRPDETAFSSGGVLAMPSAQYAWFPPMPEDLSFAVFAIDFREHGESGTPDNFSELGFLMDARTALAYAKNLPNVDPERIITMGASIGADASVDACLVLDGNQVAENQENQGCIGAMPLSPGSFLSVSYAEVVNRLADPPFDVNIHCVVTESDPNGSEICNTQTSGRHQGTIYAGRNEHGVAMLRPDMSPDIGQLIFDFLMESLGIEG